MGIIRLSFRVPSIHPSQSHATYRFKRRCMAIWWSKMDQGRYSQVQPCTARYSQVQPLWYPRCYIHLWCRFGYCCACRSEEDVQYTTCTILVGVMVIVSFSEEEDVQTAVDKSHGCCGASLVRWLPLVVRWLPPSYELESVMCSVYVWIHKERDYTNGKKKESNLMLIWRVK